MVGLTLTIHKNICIHIINSIQRKFRDLCVPIFCLTLLSLLPRITSTVPLSRSLAVGFHLQSTHLSGEPAPFRFAVPIAFSIGAGERNGADPTL